MGSGMQGRQKANRELKVPGRQRANKNAGPELTESEPASLLMEYGK